RVGFQDAGVALEPGDGGRADAGREHRRDDRGPAERSPRGRILREDDLAFGHIERYRGARPCAPTPSEAAAAKTSPPPPAPSLPWPTRRTAARRPSPSP